MFKDIIGHWAENVIKRLSQMGAVAGYEDGTFRPDRQITRAEVAAMIYKYDRRKRALLPEVVPSVVKVTATMNGKTSLGSGVILDKEGYIATNIHVVGNGFDLSQDVKVFLSALPDAGLTAKIVSGDFSQDIAILKIQADPSLLTPVTFAKEIKLFDDVICVGNPLGYGSTVTLGIVSYVRRKIAGEWIQTDCAINPGNSGGGAFNSSGEFIGLPTFKMLYADEARTIPVDNMGFISPFDKVMAEYLKVKTGKVSFTGEPSEVLTV